MDVKCFQCTDTLLISFSYGKIVETGEVNEDVLIEVCAEGKIVASRSSMRVNILVFRNYSLSWFPCEGLGWFRDDWRFCVNQTASIRLQKPGRC